MSLSILIPCRNEEKNIIDTINYLVKNLKTIEFEILLINDFSNDNTLRVIKQISKKNSRVRYFNNLKPGLGSVISNGIKKAKKKYVYIYGR